MNIFDIQKKQKNIKTKLKELGYFNKYLEDAALDILVEELLLDSNIKENLDTIKPLLKQMYILGLHKV